MVNATAQLSAEQKVKMGRFLEPSGLVYALKSQEARSESQYKFFLQEIEHMKLFSKNYGKSSTHNGRATISQSYSSP